MDDNKKSAVPRFASFRPKQSATAELPPRHEEPPEENRRPSRSRHGEVLISRPKRESRHKEDLLRGEKESRSTESRRRIREHRASREHRRHASPDSEPPREPQPTPRSSHFVIDTKGDRDNLTYRSSYRYATGHYRRIGYGRVLGLDPSFKIDPALSDNRQVVVIGTRKQQNKRRPLLHRLGTMDRELRLIKQSSDRSECEPEFIPLAHKRGNLNMDESTVPHYLASQNPVDEPTDSDMEYTSSSSSEPEPAQLSLLSDKDKVAYYERQTHSEPWNIEAWLALAKIQESLIRIDRDTLDKFSGELTGPTRRALADIRVSIYEKCLRKIATTKDTSQIWLSLLDEGAHVWDGATLAARWSEALSKKRHSEALWIAHVNYVQSDIRAFRYERCKAEYQRALSVIASLAPHTGVSNGIRNFIYLFTRFTVFVRDSGYHELAEALWQALLEFHVLDPIRGDIDTFAEWWDLEGPRIGEIGARGWWTSGDDPPPEPAAAGIYPDLPLSTAEHEAVCAWQHAGRAGNTTETDDPDHVILASDIAPFLFPDLRGRLPPRDVVDGFLCFLGLPALSWDAGSACGDFRKDPFLATPPGGAFDFLSSVLPLRFFRSTPALLFSAAFTNPPPDVDWTIRALTLLSSIPTPDSYIGEYTIALAHAFAPFTAAILAKSLLRQSRNDFRLYNALALISPRERAEHILTTALSRVPSVKDPLTFEHTCASDTLDTLTLTHTRVWKALDGGDVDMAFRCAAEARDESQVRDVKGWSENHIPAGAMFGLLCGDAMRPRNPAASLMAVELNALLAYLPTRNIQAAIKVIREAWDYEHLELKSLRVDDPVAREVLDQAQARLLSAHRAAVRAFPLALMRDTLDESLRRYPENALLVEGMVSVVGRFEGRVKGIIGGYWDQSKEVAGGVARAWWEGRIAAAIAGSEGAKVQVGRVRAAAERAVQGEGKRTGAVWMGLMRLDSGEGVWARAVKACPASKWVLLAGDGRVPLERMRELAEDVGVRVLRFGEVAEGVGVRD
ncbi:DUF1740-domain-containing protein [Trichodelitschia bisporula]|uniref:DUF1740-domain-containing protein n=1 Tax=Trichodelitschia bisporula TaxID=703511 RepID=A0A6G1HJF2_9PEZI|nr:DUF1740-domain-containing protein [Trichodelitschia bisporula]